MLVVGLGIQGHKRQAIAGDDVVATVDPVHPEADYADVRGAPLNSYDGAFVCTPDQTKLELLDYLLSNGKHVLVEKPLLAAHNEQISRLIELAWSNRVTCYTAYNHRFEPHIVRLKEVLESGQLGQIYLARFFYGNGTARNVRQSPWRDEGVGVLSDLGSHLLDISLLLFGPIENPFAPWSFNCFENRTFDHVTFGSTGSRPVIEMEATLLSWRNTFTIDIFGEMGSVHVNGLRKWGPSTFTVRKRVLPSGKPDEERLAIEQADLTWAAEYEHFKQLCQTGGHNLQNDMWINAVLNQVSRQLVEESDNLWRDGNENKNQESKTIVLDSKTSFSGDLPV
jgi:predicted dehydrogenase